MICKIEIVGENSEKKRIQVRETIKKNVVRKFWESGRKKDVGRK